MTKMENRIFSGHPAEDFAGFARAVIDGDRIHVSGTLGQGADGQMPEDAGQQAENALAAIDATLKEAGSSIADVKVARVYLVEASDLKAVAMVLGRVFGDVRPTNTLLLAGIPTPGAKVEIEVQATRS